MMDRLEAEEEAARTPAATETLAPAIPVGNSPATATAAAAQADGFPIENYDRLSIDEILDRLPKLDDEQLELVYEREDSGSGRTAILDRIDEILDEREGVSPAVGQSEEVAQAEDAAAAVAAGAPVSQKKVAAKTSPAKKTTAKTAAPAKVTTKKAPAVKKVATKAAAPVKKAAPTKTTTKATTKKSAAPAKKAPAKTTVKKAAKKATKKQ